MKIALYRFGSQAPLNQNSTCDKCHQVFHPRKHGYDAWKFAQGMDNTVVFCIDFEEQYWGNGLRPYRVNICRDCAKIFKELDRLDQYASRLHTCLDTMASYLGEEGTSAREQEQMDRVILSSMYVEARARWAAERDRVAVTIEEWWPGLEENVRGYEQTLIDLHEQQRDDPDRALEEAKQTLRALHA
jgi:hypothetical protein